jgi:hypothetical protein
MQRSAADTAVGIQRSIGMKRGNIYQILSRLINDGFVRKVEGTKKYELVNTEFTVDTTDVKVAPAVVQKLQQGRAIERQPKLTPTVNPLIPVYQREIQFVEDGIDSLMITKNYLERRVEQLKQEDARHAGSN